MSYHHISGIHVPIYNHKDDWYNYDSYPSKSNTFHVQNPVSPRESSGTDQSASASSEWVATTKAMWFAPFSTVVRVQVHVEFGGFNLLASLAPYATQQPAYLASATSDYPVSESREVLNAEQSIDSLTLETTAIKIPPKWDIGDIIETPEESTKDGRMAQAYSDCSLTLAPSYPAPTEVIGSCKESTKACSARPLVLASCSPATVDQGSALLEQRIVTQSRGDPPPVVAPSSRLNCDLDPIIPATTSFSLKSPKITSRASFTSRQGLSLLDAPFPSYRPAHHSRSRRVRQFKSDVESSATQLIILRSPAKRNGSPESPPPASFNLHFPVIQRLLWRLHGPLPPGPAYFWVSSRDPDAPISFPPGHSSGMGQESQGSGSPSNTRGEIQSGQGPGSDLSSTIGEIDIPIPDAFPDRLRLLVEEWAAASSAYAQLKAPTVRQSHAPPPPPPLGIFVDLLLRGYHMGRVDGWSDMLLPSEMGGQTPQPALPIESTTVYDATPRNLALPVPPGPQHNEDTPITLSSAPANTTTTTHSPVLPLLDGRFQSGAPRNVPVYQRQPLAPNPDEGFLTNSRAPHAGLIPRVQPVKDISGFPALHSDQSVDATIIVPTVPPYMYGYQPGWASLGNIASSDLDSKVPPGQETVEYRHLCHSCGSSYQKPYQLEDHIAAKHTSTPKRHLCEFEGCNRGYTTRSNMIKHFNKDHRSANVLQISFEATGQQPQPETTEQMLTAGILAHATIPGADTHYPGRFAPYNEEEARMKYARRRRRK